MILGVIADDFTGATDVASMLVRAGMRMALSGDSSQWDAALQMPHYSTFAMPASYGAKP